MTAVLSVIQGRNGKLLEAVALLWIKPDDRVLDMTYGRGKFWTNYRPANMVTNDLHTEADFQRDYTNAAGWAGLAGTFDVVVFDPPYITTGGDPTSGRVGDMMDRYGLSGDQKGRRIKRDELQAANALGVATCEMLLAGGGRLMVKTMDYVEGGALRLGRQHIVSTALTCGLRQVDEFVHFSGTGPQPTKNLDGSPRRQVHSRRAHSFLCVFEKPKRKATNG